MGGNYLSINRCCIFLADSIAIVGALLLSYLLRFDFSIPDSQFYLFYSALPIVFPIKAITFTFLGLYQGMWRFTGLNDFLKILYANIIAELLIIFIFVYLTRFNGFSRSIFILDCFISVIFCVGIRLSIRLHFGNIGFLTFLGTPILSTRLKSNDNSINVLIIGAGCAGEALLREILSNDSIKYNPVGFVDDDHYKVGLSIHGVKVLGRTPNIISIVDKNHIHEIIIAIPSAKGHQLRKIIELCKGTQIPYKILPALGELLEDKVSVKALRDVNYNDLLGRPPVDLSNPSISKYLLNKSILVTGAGGSIGSELCRQLIRFSPSQLILYDSNEYNLFRLDTELINELNFSNHICILGRVQDTKLMEKTLKNYKPSVVFHAAAYKHVPLVENNPWEGVFNNILGSLVAMQSSIKFNVDRFVLVSSDKAVRPTNVMGACKRVTELLMQSINSNESTKFMAVRFGNVVGSSGSVIPLFRRQIENGGPVTVTHPKATRFFMTIPEASRLILQAGAMGNGGEIFILQMGTPINIAQMAKDLIELSGKEPGEDIEIVYTGLRNGEKLYEELITTGEGITHTWHDKIMVLEATKNCNDSNHNINTFTNLKTQITDLLNISTNYDSNQIKLCLKNIVTDYSIQTSLSSLEQADFHINTTSVQTPQRSLSG